MAKLYKTETEPERVDVTCMYCRESFKVRKSEKIIQCVFCGYVLPEKSRFAIQDEWLTDDAKEIIKSYKTCCKNVKPEKIDVYKRSFAHEMEHGKIRTVRGRTGGVKETRIEIFENVDLVHKEKVPGESYEYKRREHADFKNLVDWYTEAGKGGVTRALFRLGKLYGFGAGVKEDLLTALCLIFEAASKGDVEARYAADIGLGIFDTDKWRGVSNSEIILSELSKRGFKWARAAEGVNFFHGENGYDKDYEKAYLYFKEAALDSWSRDKTGLAPIVPSDSDERQTFIHKSFVHGGSIVAKKYLAIMFFWGIGGVKQDVNKALVFLREMEPYKERDDLIYEILRGIDIWQPGKKDLNRNDVNLSCYYYTPKQSDYYLTKKPELDHGLTMTGYLMTTWNKSDYRADYDIFGGIARNTRTIYNNVAFEERTFFDRLEIDGEQIRLLLIDAVRRYKKVHRSFPAIIMDSNFIERVRRKGYEKFAKGYDEPKYRGYPFIGKIDWMGRPLGVMFSYYGIGTIECHEKNMGEITHKGIINGWARFLVAGDIFVSSYEDSENGKKIKRRRLNIGNEDALSDRSVANIGVDLEEIADFLNFVRRIILLNRREGIKLLDGNVSIANQTEIPEEHICDEKSLRTKRKEACKIQRSAWQEKLKCYCVNIIKYGFYLLASAFVISLFFWLRKYYGAISEIEFAGEEHLCDFMNRSVPYVSWVKEKILVILPYMKYLWWLFAAIFFYRCHKSFSEKRARFVCLGMILGFLGVHLLYAKRWLLFLLLVCGWILFYEYDKNYMLLTMGWLGKESQYLIQSIGKYIVMFLWLVPTFFMKKDGKGESL